MYADHEGWAVVRRYLGKAETSWSIGVLGAVAEYHSGSALNERIDDWTISCPQGSLRLNPLPSATLRAFEDIGAHRESWNHGVAVCYPESAVQAEFNCVVTELGRDREAIRPEDTESALFDLGVGSPLCRFCVRLAAPDQVNAMRRFCGRSAFDHDVLTALLAWQPQRVVLSRLGRIEVYQAIGVDRTPEGPHTHLLPKLLRPNRATSANVPLPPGYRVELIMYPAHPLSGNGEEPGCFSESLHAVFQEILSKFGDPDYVRAKYFHSAGISRGSRLERLAERIVARQSLYRCREERGD